MSASDARESIRQGGSLKDRMAALQGRGAFGGGAAPSPSPPPPSAPPLVQKPKWKPPPPPVVVPAEGEERVVSTGDVEDRAGQVDVVVDVGDEHENRGQEEGQEKEEEQGQAQAQGDQPDPEEDERQRRAAIAARMAKLGGARVGMGPPIFGGAKAPPPRVAKKPETLRSPTTSEAEGRFFSRISRTCVLIYGCQFLRHPLLLLRLQRRKKRPRKQNVERAQMLLQLTRAARLHLCPHQPSRDERRLRGENPPSRLRSQK